MNTWYWEVCLTLMLAGHLLSVNLSAAGPLFCAFLQYPAERHQDASIAQLVQRLAWLSLLTLVLGTLTGLLIAGAMWLAHDRALFAILPRFAAKITWAVAELVFYLVCMGGYLALGRRPVRRVTSVARYALALLAATNLLYHFPPLLSVLATVSHHPELASLDVRAAEFRQLAFTGRVMALTVHFWLAALAVVGVATMNLAASRSSEPTASTGRALASRLAARIALAATALQILAGTWLLVQIGPVGQNRLLGADPAGTILFGSAILATFVLLHRLAGAAFLAAAPRAAQVTMAWLVLIVVLMTGVLRRAEIPRGPRAEASVVLTSPVLSGRDLAPHND